MSTSAKPLFAVCLWAVFVTYIIVHGLSAMTTAQARGIARYVATSGNDSSNDCTNNSAPCRSIQHAVQQAAPGDDIHSLPAGVPANWWAAVQPSQRGPQSVDPLSPSSVNPLTSTPALTLTGENDDDLFGDAVATAGDVNGDGYADVIVGAGNYPGGSSKGRAYVYLGGPGGLSSTPALTLTGENNVGYFGVAVATAGDVNGDGYADVIVGAPDFSVAPARGGCIYTLAGPAG